MQEALNQTPSKGGKGLKVAAGCVLGLAAVAVIGYGSLLFWQGREFDKVAENPKAYVGEDFPPIAIQVTKKGLFEREFTLGLEDADKTVLPALQGVAKFGFHPTIEAVAAPNASGDIGELLKSVKPQVNADFTWRGIPEQVTWSTEPVTLNEDGVEFTFGAIKGLTSFTENGLKEVGNKFLSTLNSELTLSSFTAKADDELFATGEQKVVLLVKEKGPNFIDLTYDIKGLRAENIGDVTKGSLESGHFKVTLDGTKDMLTQAVHWDLGPLKAKVGLFPVKVQDFTGDVNVFMPNNPEMIGFAARMVLGDKTCQLFPKFCPKNAAAPDDNVLLNTFRDGASWVQLQKATLAMKEATLGASGQFKVEKDVPQIASLNLNLKTEDAKATKFLTSLLPKGVYRSEKDELLSTLTLKIEDGNLVLRAENVELGRF